MTTLHINWASLNCSFSGETPPRPGQTYMDQNGNKWTVRDGVERALVLSDCPVWKVPIGTIQLDSDIPSKLILRRIYSSDEIRKARQSIQDLGISCVSVFDDEYIVVNADDVDGKDMPQNVDGIPVIVRDNEIKV